MMTIFEPLFILLVLTTIAVLFMAAVAALTGRPANALKLLRRLGIAAAAYFTIVLAVAALGTQKVYHVGDMQCFDDWCITVSGVAHAPAGAGQAWTVTLRISSRAKRVSQRENGAAVYLTDSQHRRFAPDATASEPPLDTRLEPGESVETKRTFQLPPDAAGVSLVFAHEGGFPIGALIIGENEFFHKLAIVKLD